MAKKISRREINSINNCIFIIDNDQINWVLNEIHPILFESNLKPQIIIKQENAMFYEISNNETNFYSLVQKSKIFDEEELYFLNLKSMFNILWDSKDYEKYSTVFLITEFNVDIALFRIAKFYALNNHKNIFKKVPYWLQDSQFQILNTISDEHKELLKEFDIPIYLIKSGALNAYTYNYSSNNYICFDFGLEAFLTNLNKFFISFTEFYESMDEKFILECFETLLPRFLYFKGYIKGYQIPPTFNYHDKNHLLKIRHYTNDQIKFLLCHEYGHIALKHREEKSDFNSNDEYIKFENKQEYDADIFALNFFRSNTSNLLRKSLHPNQIAKRKNPLDQPVDIIVDFNLAIEAINTLFVILAIMELFENNLTLILPDIFKGTENTSHPPALERIKNIRNHSIFDIPSKSKYLQNITEIQQRLNIFFNITDKDLIKQKIKQWISN